VWAWDTVSGQIADATNLLVSHRCNGEEVS
jgi:hypothetical protein